MAKVISIINQKGGIGKSTTTLNLGWALINKGKKVLLIDFDAQSSLTISMKFEPHLMGTTIYNVLNGYDIRKDIITDNENFFFVPSNINLAAAELELKGKHDTLKNCLKPVIDFFDYILIDCPPSLGNLSINALVASDGVVVPMQTQFLCWEGFGLLQNTIEECRAYNPKLKILGLLPTMFKKNNHNKQVLEIIQGTGLAFNVVIPDRVAFQDSTVEGLPVCDIDKELGELYERLAQEVIDRGEQG
jgi:chromosome partitioning protein